GCAPRAATTAGSSASSSPTRSRRPPLLALLFPGQGSQRVGMARDACEASPAARAVFEAADRALGMPLSRLCFEGPAEALVATEIQQPAILTASVALLRALEERAGGPLPAAYLGGHSLGEYTALVAAGALALEDAVRLVRARGTYMQEAVPSGTGAMIAVLKLESALIEAVAREVSNADDEPPQVVEIANYNAPGQTVLSGTRAGIEAAGARLKEAGGRVIPLKVSAPFHCSLMRPAAERLAVDLARTTFSEPTFPVVC